MDVLDIEYVENNFQDLALRLTSDSFAVRFKAQKDWGRLQALDKNICDYFIDRLQGKNLTRKEGLAASFLLLNRDEVKLNRSFKLVIAQEYLLRVLFDGFDVVGLETDKLKLYLLDEILSDDDTLNLIINSIGRLEDLNLKSLRTVLGTRLDSYIRTSLMLPEQISQQDVATAWQALAVIYNLQYNKAEWIYLASKILHIHLYQLSFSVTEQAGDNPSLFLSFKGLAAVYIKAVNTSLLVVAGETHGKSKDKYRLMAVSLVSKLANQTFVTVGHGATQTSTRDQIANSFDELQGEQQLRYLEHFSHSKFEESDYNYTFGSLAAIGPLTKQSLNKITKLLDREIVLHTYMQAYWPELYQLLIGTFINTVNPNTSQRISYLKYFFDSEKPNRVALAAIYSLFDGRRVHETRIGDTQEIKNYLLKILKTPISTQANMRLAYYIMSVMQEQSMTAPELESTYVRILTANYKSLFSNSQFDWVASNWIANLKVASLSALLAIQNKKELNFETLQGITEMEFESIELMQLTLKLLANSKKYSLKILENIVGFLRYEGTSLIVFDAIRGMDLSYPSVQLKLREHFRNYRHFILAKKQAPEVLEQLGYNALTNDFDTCKSILIMSSQQNNRQIDPFQILWKN